MITNFISWSHQSRKKKYGPFCSIIGTKGPSNIPQMRALAQMRGGPRGIVGPYSSLGVACNQFLRSHQCGCLFAHSVSDVL